MSKWRPILVIAVSALCYSSFSFAENANDADGAGADSSNKIVDGEKPGAKYFSLYPDGFPADPDQPYGSRWLPPGRPFPSVPVDPRDLKIGFRKTNGSSLEADVGGYRSVFGWKGDVSGKDMVLHAGIEGGAYFTMRKEGARFPLESSDGLFGVYVEAVRDSWFYQFRFTHISAHLSDGITDVRVPIRYSREYFMLRVAKQWHWLRPYFALHYLVHIIPNDLNSVGAQAGFYGYLPVEMGLFRPYFGADYRYYGGREGNTLNLGIGLALISELAGPSLRFTLNYMRGNDLRGQFFTDKIKKIYGGFELDF